MFVCFPNNIFLCTYINIFYYICTSIYNIEIYCYLQFNRYHHTMSPPLIWALRRCLEEICKITLPKFWEQHAKTTAHFHKRLQEFGFKFLVPKPEDRLVTVTTVVLPDGYNYIQFVKYMRER